MQHNSHFVRSYSRKQILIQAVIKAPVGVLSQDYVSMAVMMAYCLLYELFQEIWLNWLTNNPVTSINSDIETWKKVLWLSIPLDLLNSPADAFNSPIISTGGRAYLLESHLILIEVLQVLENPLNQKISSSV